MLIYNPEYKINLPEKSRGAILEHCHLALDAFNNGVAQEGKAFGLVFGSVSEQFITAANCFPLKQNVRSKQPYKDYMDRVMAEHAIPSITPLERRGWVADPAELFARIRECREVGQELVGTYHMHRVGWKHDSKRDTPTKLDAVLAKDSGMVMFIVSMVDPAKPVIRAFYEGIVDQEIPVI